MKTEKKKSFYDRFAYNKKIAPYLFVLPFIIAFLLFFAYPIIDTFTMSFEKVVSFKISHFIGLKNYARLDNQHFFNALRTSTIYTCCMVVIMLIMPITLAVFLNSRLLKLKNLFRSVIFIPALVSTISAGIAFRLIFGDTEIGFVNSIIVKLGGTPVTWKMGYVSGIFIMVVLASWREMGINMIYCLSALQSISAELYESADVDGASKFQQFIHITIPQVKPIIIYVLTLTIINGYRMFTEGYVYWNETNPGDNGLTIVRYIYNQAFQKNDMGLGSAIGMVLLLIILVINLIQLKGFGMFEKEDR